MHFGVLDYFNHSRVNCQAQNAFQNVFFRIFEKLLSTVLNVLLSPAFHAIHKLMPLRDIDARRFRVGFGIANDPPRMIALSI